MKHSSRVMSFVTALTMPTVMGPFSHSVSPFDCRRNPDQVTSESSSSARRERIHRPSVRLRSDRPRQYKKS
jgi:hypothetical protein